METDTTALPLPRLLPFQPSTPMPMPYYGHTASGDAMIDAIRRGDAFTFRRLARQAAADNDRPMRMLAGALAVEHADALPRALRVELLVGHLLAGVATPLTRIAELGQELTRRAVVSLGSAEADLKVSGRWPDDGRAIFDEALARINDVLVAAGEVSEGGGDVSALVELLLRCGEFGIAEQLVTALDDASGRANLTIAHMVRLRESGACQAAVRLGLRAIATYGEDGRVRRTLAATCRRDGALEAALYHVSVALTLEGFDWTVRTARPIARELGREDLLPLLDRIEAALVLKLGDLTSDGPHSWVIATIDFLEAAGHSELADSLREPVVAGDDA
jgi:hypothetical protein